MDTARPEPRRRLFQLALAAVAGYFSSKIAEPQRVFGADGNPVIAGSQFNSSTSTTVLKNTTEGGTAFDVEGSGWGVVGTAAGGTGVMGHSTSYRGVVGSTSTGHAVHAVAEGDAGVAIYGTSKYGSGLVAMGGPTGVLGLAGQSSIPDGLNAGLVGVYGYSDVSGDAAGVVGKSGDGVGTVGVSDNSVGLLGVGPIGVQGDGYFGVYGAGRHGVVGDATPGDTGIFGWVGVAAPQAAPTGVAVHAQAEPGYTALNVVGVARFSRSGRTSFASGKASKVVAMAGVTTASYVVATLQANRSGIFVRAVVCVSGQFTIYLNKAVASATDVGFLVIN